MSMAFSAAVADGEFLNECRRRCFLSEAPRVAARSPLTRLFPRPARSHDRVRGRGAMTTVDYRLDDLGDRRVLTVDGRSFATEYSARLLRMLIDRKGPRRAVPYLTYRETRGRHFLGPLFRYFDRCGARCRQVLEVACSFGHVTEYLAAQPSVDSVRAFDTDAAFVAMTRLKISELQLDRVHDVALLTNAETCS